MKGIAWGVALSVPLWAVIGLVVLAIARLAGVAL